jgi:hypothetical protein
MMEVSSILLQYKKGRRTLFISEIDYDTMLSNFNGLTFFQIFKTAPDYFQLLQRKLIDNDIKNQFEITDDGEKVEHILIRKIYWTLKIPVFMKQ